MPVFQSVAVPVAPQEGIEIPATEAVDCLGDLALEGQPPKLAVGDDLAARCLLQGDDVVYCRVFAGPELGRVQLTGGERFARVQQRLRTQQAADVVDVDADHLSLVSKLNPLPEPLVDWSLESRGSSPYR